MRRKLFILLIILLTWSGCQPKRDISLDGAKRLNLSIGEFNQALSDSPVKEWQKFKNSVVTWEGVITDIIEDNLDRIILEGEKADIKKMDLVCINLENSALSLYTSQETALSFNKGDRIRYDGKIKVIENYQDTYGILMLGAGIKRKSRTNNANLSAYQKNVINDLSILETRNQLTEIQQSSLLESITGKIISWNSKINRIVQAGDDKQAVCDFDLFLRIILEGNALNLAGVKKNSTVSYKAKVLKYNEASIPAVLNLEVTEIQN